MANDISSVRSEVTAKEKRMTLYRIFRRTSVAGGIPTFQHVGNAPAHNPKQAITAYLSNLDNADTLSEHDGETFAACPDRGWVETTVAVRTETKVKVG